MEARAVLRQLLRAVDSHLTRVAGNTQWRDYALQQFRANAGLQDAQQVQQQLQIARDYTFLINTIAQHRALLKEYNIGLDPDERSKEMVNAMARRMGFELPTTHEQQQPPQQQQQQEQWLDGEQLQAQLTQQQWQQQQQQQQQQQREQQGQAAQQLQVHDEQQQQLSQPP